MNQLPEDINMLLSFVNMKLRDEYEDLDELCATLGVEKAWLIDRLATGGFEYNQQQKRFW
ncbi:MAG: DUF4250 domain-containing protein [Paludibacteraceae bacterium]|nr:DUF4250 domain-containing protein [Paludibacteraceae bacterium]